MANKYEAIAGFVGGFVGSVWILGRLPMLYCLVGIGACVCFAQVAPRMLDGDILILQDKYQLEHQS